MVLENNDSLENVDGLAQLFSVPGDFFFRHNRALKNLDGFLSLNSIGGKLVIEDHPELENIDGLFQVPTLGGEAFLKDNPSLKNVDGLASLTFINKIYLLNRDLTLDVLEYDSGSDDDYMGTVNFPFSGADALEPGIYLCPVVNESEGSYYELEFEIIQY